MRLQSTTRTWMLVVAASAIAIGGGVHGFRLRKMSKAHLAASQQYNLNYVKWKSKAARFDLAADNDALSVETSKTQLASMKQMITVGGIRDKSDLERIYTYYKRRDYYKASIGYHRECARRARAVAAYHADLEAKYLYASRHPWSPPPTLLSAEPYFAFPDNAPEFPHLAKLDLSPETEKELFPTRIEPRHLGTADH